MAKRLVLGPLLRYTGVHDATIWVETGSACEVEASILGPGGSPGTKSHRSRTFRVGGHHYALVVITGLDPGSTYEYSVHLDGEKVWPEEGSPFPRPVIRTMQPNGGEELVLAFGSCRVAAPHEPPYTLKRRTLVHGGGYYERDALYALACRMRRQPSGEWPDALLLLGDQVYADEISAGTRDFVRSRRGPDEDPPEEEVANFEEYTHLYKDSWGDPVLRWLLSTLPSAMIFDDHDVNDDWNTSETWLRQMRAKPWWEERIIGGFVSYWIYQHLGNLSPEELEESEIYKRVVAEEGDAAPVLRAFARRADREVGSSRWSFHRDFGRVRLIMTDSRAGRVVEEQHRSMLHDAEWAWVEDRATGEFDHLLFGTSLPLILAPGLHHLEAWNEAVCGGAWGRLAAWLGEGVRQLADLEHWSAFRRSFDGFAELLRSVSAGKRSKNGPPASVIVLSGDVHHGYLAEIDLENGSTDGSTNGAVGSGARSPVYQAVSSPLRNPLSLPERLALRAGWTRRGAAVGRGLARLAGVGAPNVSWRLAHEKPWFDNHISTLMLRGREAVLKVEKTTPEDEGEPRLHKILERRLA